MAVDNSYPLVGMEQGAARIFTRAVDGGTDGAFEHLGTDVVATGLEINRACDVSARIVTETTDTLAVTEALHDGKTIVMAMADSPLAETTYTLPAATGSGARFRFVVGAVNTANYIITVTGNDVLYGNVIINSTGDSPDLTEIYPTAADSDTVTLNGTTQGGAKIGDWLEFEDIAADTYTVRGMLTGSGTVVTPFSAT